MNFQKNLILLISLIFVFTTCSYIWAENGNDYQHNENVKLLIQKLMGSNWQESDEALAKLQNNKADEQVVGKVIERVKHETAFRKKNTAPVGEGRGEYYFNLLNFLCNLDNRKEIIQPLIESFDVASGVAVPNKLAEIGESCVKPLVDKYKRSGYRAKCSILRTIRIMLEKTKLSPTSRELARELISLGLNDESSFVREYAIDGVKVFGDKSFVLKLETIAQEDSFFIQQAINEQRVKVYPVREKAQETLNFLSKSE